MTGGRDVRQKVVRYYEKGKKRGESFPFLLVSETSPEEPVLNPLSQNWMGRSWLLRFTRGEGDSALKKAVDVMQSVISGILFASPDGAWTD